MTVDVIAAARRRTRRASLVLLMGLALVACLLGAVLHHQHGTGDAATPARTDAPSASPGVSMATGGLLPADVVWVRLAGVDLPASPTAGPAHTIAGLASGFAHSPAGAVLAAAHLLVRTTPQVGPAIFTPTLQTQVVGDFALAMRQTVTDDYTRAAAGAGIPYGQPLGDLPAALAGARIDTFTDVSAVLSVLTSAVDADGVVRDAGCTVTLAWADNDWRLVAPPGGRWDGLVHPVDPGETGAYTPLREAVTR